MSRIGKQPIAVLDGVKVAINGQTITAEGPKGKLELEHRLLARREALAREDDLVDILHPDELAIVGVGDDHRAVLPLALLPGARRAASMRE